MIEGRCAKLKERKEKRTQMAGGRERFGNVECLANAGFLTMRMMTNVMKNYFRIIFIVVWILNLFS